MPKQQKLRKGSASVPLKAPKKLAKAQAGIPSNYSEKAYCVALGAYKTGQLDRMTLEDCFAYGYDMYDAEGAERRKGHINAALFDCDYGIHNGEWVPITSTTNDRNPIIAYYIQMRNESTRSLLKAGKMVVEPYHIPDTGKCLTPEHSLMLSAKDLGMMLDGAKTDFGIPKCPFMATPVNASARIVMKGREGVDEIGLDAWPSRRYFEAVEGHDTNIAYPNLLEMLDPDIAIRHKVVTDSSKRWLSYCRSPDNHLKANRFECSGDSCNICGNAARMESNDDVGVAAMIEEQRDEMPGRAGSDEEMDECDSEEEEFQTMRSRMERQAQPEIAPKSSDSKIEDFIKERLAMRKEAPSSTPRIESFGSRMDIGRAPPDLSPHPYTQHDDDAVQLSREEHAALVSEEMESLTGGSSNNKSLTSWYSTWVWTSKLPSWMMKSLVGMTTRELLPEKIAFSIFMRHLVICCQEANKKLDDVPAEIEFMARECEIEFDLDDIISKTHSLGKIERKVEALPPSGPADESSNDSMPASRRTLKDAPEHRALPKSNEKKMEEKRNLRSVKTASANARDKVRSKHRQSIDEAEDQPTPTPTTQAEEKGTKLADEVSPHSEIVSNHNQCEAIDNKESVSSHPNVPDTPPQPGPKEGDLRVNGDHVYGSDERLSKLLSTPRESLDAFHRMLKGQTGILEETGRLLLNDWDGALIIRVPDCSMLNKRTYSSMWFVQESNSASVLIEKTLDTRFRELAISTGACINPELMSRAATPARSQVARYETIFTLFRKRPLWADIAERELADAISRRITDEAEQLVAEATFSYNRMMGGNSGVGPA